jgi:hypothetical protein
MSQISNLYSAQYSFEYTGIKIGFPNVQNGPIKWESSISYVIVWDIYFEKEGF